MGKDEHSWKFRAETAEALLEAEREEVERLRAYIKELEAQLPDEEGGEEPEQPQKSTEGDFIRDLLKLAGPDQFSPSELEYLMTKMLMEPPRLKRPEMPRIVMDEYPLDPLDSPPRKGMLEKLMRKRQVAAEVSLEVRVNAERMEEEARVALKLDDGRTFHYAVGHPTIERIRGDARSAGPLIHNITQAFASSMGDRMPMPLETLRGSVGSVIMDLIERKKGRDEYIAF